MQTFEKDGILFEYDSTGIKAYTMEKILVYDEQTALDPAQIEVYATLICSSIKSRKPWFELKEPIIVADRFIISKGRVTFLYENQHLSQRALRSTDSFNDIIQEWRNLVTELLRKRVEKAKTHYEDKIAEYQKHLGGVTDGTF